jgi:hypothetical protein
MINYKLGETGVLQLPTLKIEMNNIEILIRNENHKRLHDLKH